MNTRRTQQEIPPFESLSRPEDFVVREHLEEVFTNWTNASIGNLWNPLVDSRQRTYYMEAYLDEYTGLHRLTREPLPAPGIRITSRLRAHLLPYEGRSFSSLDPRSLALANYAITAASIVDHAKILTKQGVGGIRMRRRLELAERVAEQIQPVS